MDHPRDMALPWGLHSVPRQLKRVPLPRRVCFPSAGQSWGTLPPISESLISRTPSSCSQRGAHEQPLRATKGALPTAWGKLDYTCSPRCSCRGRRGALQRGPQLTDGIPQFCLQMLRHSWHSDFMRCHLLTVVPYGPAAADSEHGRAQGICK